jgi:hypothetical protein
MSPGQCDPAMKVEAIRLFREQKKFTSKRAFSIQLDLMGQICERALSKRFAHRDLLLHLFSVESMSMVGCICRRGARARTQAAALRSAMRRIGGVRAWRGVSLCRRGRRTAAAPRRLAGVQRRSRGASPPMSAVYVAASWLCFTWRGKCCQKKSLFPTTGKKQTSALCRTR